MGTRCLIGKYNPDNETVVASYCHYDGYIAHTGAVLNEFYADDFPATAIANIGYASYLHNTYAETFEAAAHKGIQPKVFNSVEDYLKTGDSEGAEYLYLWDGEAWFVANLYGSDHRFEAVENFFEKTA